MTTAHTISNSIAFRKIMVALTALVIFSIPLVSFAGSTPGPAPDASPFKTNLSPEQANDPEGVYTRLKSRSQKICGSSDLQISGSVQRSRQSKECYEGTLTAAVDRLDNTEVTMLHYQ